MKLLDKLLSDEDEPFADNTSSDEYVPTEDKNSGECSSDDDGPVVKKNRNNIKLHPNFQ